MRAQTLSIAVLAAGALAVAGCGGSNDNKSSGGGSASTSKQSAPSATGGGSTVKLSETEFKITPADPKVKKTGTVTFSVSNDGQITHALEVEGPSGEKKTANISPGSSATLKVDVSKAGSYEFYCPIDGHKQNGMKGELKVGSGSGSSSSGSSQDSGGGGGGAGY